MDTALRGLAELLGFEHSILLLVDETGARLYTIASHGYAAEGVGSEVVVGDGTAGVAADQCRAVRVANVGQNRRDASIVRAGDEAAGDVGPGREIAMPGLADVESQLAVPLMAMGRFVGVLNRDNLESRLILLKCRLDERDAPVRIEKTGRGRFRLMVGTPLQLEVAGA